MLGRGDAFFYSLRAGAADAADEALLSLGCWTVWVWVAFAGIDTFLSAPLGSSLAKALCFCGKPFLNCFSWSRHVMRLESFLAAKAAGYLVLITWRWSPFSQSEACHSNLSATEWVHPRAFLQFSNLIGWVREGVSVKTWVENAHPRCCNAGSTRLTNCNVLLIFNSGHCKVLRREGRLRPGSKVRIKIAGPCGSSRCMFAAPCW